MKGERDEIYSKLDDYADRLIDIMVNYHMIAAGYVPPMLDLFFNPKTMKKINARAKDLDEALKEKPTNANIYRQSMWEHHAKLAMLRRIAEDRLEELAGLKQVTVDEENLSKAAEFLDPIFEKTEDIILSIGEEPQPIRTFEEPLERVYKTISYGGKVGISRSELYRKTKMISDDLDKLVGALIRQKRIEQITDLHTGGRPKVSYRIIE